MSSHNFYFLHEKWELLSRLGEAAERYIYQDPNASISKLRLFCETTAKYVMALEEIEEKQKMTQVDRLYELNKHDLLTREISDLFHLIRKKGNSASHDATYGEVAEAKTLHRMAFRIGVWLMETYGDWQFQAPDYQEPKQKEMISASEIEKLTEEYEEKLSHLEDELKRILQAQQELQNKEKQARRKQGTRSGSNLKLTEEETRVLIDQQLRDAGWEVDTWQLRFSKGTRPQKGKNRAIAEWPLQKGYADYALFVGLELVGLIEAKRASKDIPADIEQAKTYAKLVVKHSDEQIHEPWGDYFVPFLFATNGRPYLKQLEQKSGIWFLDARKSTNHPKALQDWYSPEGLKRLLTQDVQKAEQTLRDEKFDYLKLRPYQVNAIQSVEDALSQKQQKILLAMATGTGKTRTAIGLIYRLIKAKRFNRILFLVDRTALGEQAEAAFQDSKLESFHTFTEIYELQSLRDKKPNPETKVQIATVQSMMKRLFFQEDAKDKPTVDQYDCVIVDEAHRGYTLDGNMSELELEIRDHQDYVSKYRKVLDYFDAVRIGLTATPALHTTEIFGPPVYNYSYREAVVEGYLVDHEPPFEFDTQLKKNGIHFKRGQEVETYDTKTQTVAKEYMQDETNIQVTQFNTKVITENFNRVITEELVNHLDPYGEAKTLIFCATDDHADMVVSLLKKTLADVHGEIEDNAVMKITGSIHDPSGAIKRFKNERYPNIVVTVDLLTTGIDVPAISNLVFLRRVSSRILYEQMLGRATRKCDEIGKDHFKIFDAVGIYNALKAYSDMRPVVTRPQVPIMQLVDELDKIVEEKDLKKHQEQIIAKIQRKLRNMSDKQEQTFQTLAGGQSVEKFIETIKQTNLPDLAKELTKHKTLLQYLDENKDRESKQYISKHEDELIGVTRGYGEKEKPEDYLTAFGNYIRENRNKIPALMVVCQRPSDLTREELKKLRLELDQLGYSEKSLQTAWRDAKNEDIAADIIAFIRQQALGDPLVSHEERIKSAMKKVYQMKVWPPVQKQWLERIEKQLLHESILHPDPEKAFDYEPFKSRGGYKQLDKIFKGELANIVQTINQNLYRYQKEKA
ncbi:type I restriction-modification system endonuclease [Risungbinella massiliensis]|uniref:type I restriction-modification system endonuclease n=1 Tax=Risungbinella massiliensis TaxID=1329796 RepID=UPI0005CBDA84|nr:type I restriction-modification system endonuclease [Risungbinella massiliensis]